MAPVVLSEFSLAVDIDTFLELFWRDTQWYEEFLTEKLLDLSVNVEEWAPSAENPAIQARTVKSYHPSKISFPGLPSHAESWKAQTLDVMKDGSGKVVKAVVRETNSFRGIPYADYFNVITEWMIQPASGDNTGAGQQKSAHGTQNRAASTIATVYLDFQFHKSTWLQGTIESNTKAELVGVYELWVQSAQHTVRRHQDRRALGLGGGGSVGNLRIGTGDGGSVGGGDLEIGHGARKDSGEHGASAGEGEEGEEDDLEGMDVLRLSSSGASTPTEARRKARSYDAGSRSGSEYRSDEEDMEFYDCEEGGGAGGSGAGLGRGRSKEGFGSNGALSAELLRYYPAGGSRTADGRPQGFPVPGAHDLDSTTSARDIAVTIVEAVFVLAEFSYWRVHQLYAQDLKEVFDVDPERVASRVRNAFLPGWHSPLLLQPDLYGPVLAVAALPQCLLISMEIARHGCNPTTQLGNALVVSLFIWLGLSGLYRLLALLVAPSIELKHCLCVTGYGFFAWNVALLCIYPLENFSDSLGIPTMLPLVIFGIPSSLAQGAMFWEHTPASSLTLQPSQLPPSMQQFATTHNRCLQKIVWALPKILAFLLVAGTHYQFLWYMARVFLPGRRQLCKLSALVQPKHYADILTQKELRNFAISLFGKGGR